MTDGNGTNRSAERSFSAYKIIDAFNKSLEMLNDKDYIAHVLTKY